MNKYNKNNNNINNNNKNNANNGNNNFGRIGTGDVAMRFNKRPRYGSNVSNLRYPHQSSSTYQYLQNRNNITDSYLSNQYEKGTRHFYGGYGSSKAFTRPNHSHEQKNNKTLPYIHKLTPVSSLSPPTSEFSPNATPSKKITSTCPSTAVIVQNQQQQHKHQQQQNKQQYKQQQQHNQKEQQQQQQQQQENQHRQQHLKNETQEDQSIQQNYHQHQSKQQEEQQEQQEKQKQQHQQQQQQQQEQLQQQQLHQPQITQNMFDSTNYFNFGFNHFYPNFNTDLVPPSSTFCLTEGISPFLWQTITSTPPPKLLQQIQTSQPPLPTTQPPILPPLPGNDEMSPLQPPPPIPSTILDSSAEGKSDQNVEQVKEHENAPKTIVKIKAKRKAMSTRYKMSKSWSEEDALLALKAEEENVKKLQKDLILILRFPDPEISRDIVKCYSPDIESVHFQLNFAPRYCLIHLKPGTDVEKTMDTLSKIPFGTGFLSVEIKQVPHKVHTTKLNEIDPYTLYVGNLPTTIACKTLKEHFPGAARIDIGFAQRMKYTRYAFIRYTSVHQAIEAYKRMMDAEISGRTLTIRFRRLATTNEGNKDGDTENPDDVQDDQLSQSAVISESNSINLGKNVVNSSENNEVIISENSPREIDKEADDLDLNTAESHIRRESDETSDSPNVAETSNTENNLPENVSSIVGNVNDNDTNTGLSAMFSETMTEDNVNTCRLNIKPDPDIDPEDIVNRNDAIQTRFDISTDVIKQEQATDFEFFAPANSLNDTDENNRNPPQPTTDDTDTLSTMSTSSLGEFLQTCQRPYEMPNDIDDIIGPPPTKRNKSCVNDLTASIKREPPSSQDVESREGSQIVANDYEPVKIVKQEPVENNELGCSGMDISPKNVLLQNTETTNQAFTNNCSNRIETANRCDSSNNNDAIVPPNALFLRNVQHSLTKVSSVYDNDEIFETKTVQSKTPILLRNPKEEPFDRSTNKSTNENSAASLQQVTSKKRKHTNENKNSSITQDDYTHFSIKESRTLRNIAADSAAYDDDLVPDENMLSSRQSSQFEDLLQNPFSSCHEKALEIKQETETEDIFSTPFNNNNNNNKLNDLSEYSELSDLQNKIVSHEVSGTNSTLQENNDKKVVEVKKNSRTFNANEDDDIIIISENISPQANEPKSKKSTTNNLFAYGQTDLLTFKPKPTGMVHGGGVTKLAFRDNLDKLFDQLDSDSDSEL